MCEDVAVSTRNNAGLTADDLQSLSAGLAEGKRVSVYLRDPLPSLGLDAGASARVVAIDGSTVTVRPKGVDDQLPFSADELRRTRPAPSVTDGPRRRTNATTASPADPPTPTKSGATEMKSPSEPPARPKPARRARPTTTAVAITITSGPGTTWTIGVSHGSRRQGKPAEVTADKVARAMRELGDDGAITAVDGVIESAREAAQKRVEELRQELETARAALADLDGSV